MPHVRKHKTNPVNGEHMAPKDLIRLNFSKNEVIKSLSLNLYRLNGGDWIDTLEARWMSVTFLKFNFLR